MSVSSEKIDLMTSLAKSFNGTDKAKLGSDCVFVRPQSVASGAAAQQLYTTWDENIDGPKPVVWSPAASSWGQIVNEKLSEAGIDPNEPLEAAAAPADPASPTIPAAPE